MAAEKKLTADARAQCTRSPGISQSIAIEDKIGQFSITILKTLERLVKLREFR